MSEDKLFTQEEVNKLVGEARKEGHEKGAEKTRAELTAELEALRGFKTQAESQAESLQKYQGVLEGILTSRLEGFDEKAKAAVQELPLDTVGKLEWLNKHGAVFGEAHGTPKTGQKKTAAVAEAPRKQLRL